MISLELACKLKLKLNRQTQVKIMASAEVKRTLGPRVVYILELWVANIGEGLDVLPGMDFMFPAGVRVCVRQGLVQLPNEESILMHDVNVKVPQGVDLPITSLENLYLMPGEHAVNERSFRLDVGDRWVTEIVYLARSWPVAIKVVNVSKHSPGSYSMGRSRMLGASSALGCELIVNGRL
ncbi:hypothetical protein PHMEG_00012144 [Phytophthora megakarya]|uniref:Eukaryotic/viral aspartic protease n=1 Tax=Phytophthora megakarya TaxID=4795 RepID=A0A225WAF4_9STRA|nr:hypothetical protein PHMEG_00012144 [Phytophthora megakarya]